ncbi:MAG: ribokinase [Clostridiales bacterium]|jgi:ribokinase|nr:ribokinase [Clostridiales bacterium]
MNKVIVLGSINMDLVISSPYMPAAGETIMGNDFITNPGGKGANQAAACGNMGAQVYMCGCVGDDVFGEKLIDNLKSFGVNCDFVRAVKGASSGIAVIIITENDNRIILDSGANALVSREDVDRALEVAGEGDILMAQLEIPIDTVIFGLKKAKQKGMITILNPAPANKACQPAFEFADYLIPNESELELLSGEKVLQLAANKLFEAGVKKLIVTLGSKGSVFVDRNDLTYVKSYKVKVVDTTAAGDTYCGTFAAELSRGKPPLQAMDMASAASSLAVTKKGAQMSIPTWRQVADFMKSYAERGAVD